MSEDKKHDDDKAVEVKKDLPEYETKSIPVEVAKGNYKVYVSPKGNQHVIRAEKAEDFEKALGVDHTWIKK